MEKSTPVIKINPDIEVMNPDDFEEPEMYVVVAKDEPLAFCDHQEICIYPHHRLIECRKCKKRIDPFDYILNAGRQSYNFVSHMKYLKMQMDRMINEEQDLAKLYKELVKRKHKR